MRYPEAFLENLRAQTALSDFISAHVPLKKKGREYQACCPFHQEKTPSFTVNNEKGFYHCFGCGAHGSLFDFLMQIEKLTFPEAVEKVADHLGVALPEKREETFEEKEKKSLRDQLLAIHMHAASFFEQDFHSSLGVSARAYCERRGIEPTFVQKFRLGYATPDRHALYRHLQEKGYGDDVLRHSGLIIFPEDGERRPYDKFRNRLMFPIFNVKDQVIAFGGRILGEGEPKYLNSPETEIFKKGYELYNLNFARMSKERKDPWIIVEGYMDALALFQKGIETVVSPLGTALTENHIKKVWRYCEKPVLCFDGDRAGEKASLRAAEKILPFLKPGYSLNFAFLPEGHDPDSFVVEKGRDAFKSLMSDKKFSLIDVVWADLRSQVSLKEPEDRAKLKKLIGSTSSLIEDVTIREFYKRDLNDRFFQEQRRKSFPGQGLQQSFKGRRPQTEKNLKEKLLLALLISYPFLVEHFEEELVLVDLGEDSLRDLKKEILEYYYNQKALEKGALETHLRKEHEGLVSYLLEKGRAMHISQMEKETGLVEDECSFILKALKEKRGRNLDLMEAKDSLKRDFGVDAWKRFQALKKTLNDDAI